jgi:iron(III) transport system substrate-binding protein
MRRKKSEINRRGFLNLTGAAGAAVLASPFVGRYGRAFAASGDVDPEILAKAKEEGALMFYSGMDEGTTRALADGFTKKFGIPAQFYRGGSKVTPKYLLELQNNAVLTDIVQESNMPAFLSMAKNGQLEEWSPPEAANVDPSLTTPHFSIISTIAATWMWNTRQISDEQSPKAYQDFLKPDFKGRLGMPDVSLSASGPPTQWYYVMRQRLGQDFMKELGKQQFRFYQIFGDTSNAVASGEIALTPVMLNYYTLQLQAKGAPVADRFPKPAFVTDRPMGLAVKAPHPNAGKLFLNYCLSPEGQTAIAARFSIPVRSDVETPKGVPLPGTFEAVRVDDWAKMGEMTDALQKEFTEYFKS